MADAGLLGTAHALGLQPNAGAAMEPLTQQLAAPPIAGQRINFDEGWRFMLGDPAQAQTKEFSDAAWRVLDVPHDWSIEGSFDENAPGGGTAAYLPTGNGWYRKSFVLAKNTAGKRITLAFDGVYQRSEVWVNGVSLGMRPYGFIGFSYDLTPHLAPAGKVNQIAVRVDNSLQPNCRWYSGSGIYRRVWVGIGGFVFFSGGKPFVKVVEVTESGAKINISSEIRNDGGHEMAAELTIEIMDPTGNIVGKDTAKKAIGKEMNATIDHQFVVKEPVMWSPADPQMYQARCTLIAGGEVTDQTICPFGIRTVVFDVNRGLLLNGQHVKMNGVCIHGDGGSVGTAVPERIWQRRLELLQEMGCNAIRLSHNPPAPELLDMLDRTGFLVMAEGLRRVAPAKGSDPAVRISQVLRRVE